MMNPILTASLFLATLGDPAPAAAPTTASEIDASALLEPTVIRHKTDDGQRWLEGVRTVVDERLSSGDRRRLGTKVLSESRVTIVEGAFGGGAAALVTLNVALRRPDAAADPLHISGVFTLDTTGKLGHAIVPLQMRAERYTLEAIGDVDGDGLHDFVLIVTDAQSQTGRMVRWESGAPVESEAPPIPEGC